MHRSLLPPNATVQERALEATVRRATDQNVPVRYVWSPDACPKDLLPWLAWALSVDVWDPSWPEAVKRDVLRASVGVHRKKGTVGAVRRALEALDLGAITIREWFEYGGTPHTFRVFAELTNRGLSAEEVAALDRALAATKPVRSHIDDFRLYLGARGAVPSVAAASLNGETATVYPYATTQVESRGAVPLCGAALYGVDTMTVYPLGA